MSDRSMHDDQHDGEHDGMSSADEEFARQLAAPLRAPEPLGDAFDERVMAAIRHEYAADASRVPIPLWRRRRAVALTPVAWMALAAGFAGIVSLATLSLAHTGARTGAPANSTVAATAAPIEPRAQLASYAPTTDTVYVVRFVLADARAHTVTLLGDFNAWAKHATPLTTTGKRGVWSAQVALAPGRHEYAFLVDGKRWVADPAAEHHADDFGTQSSVVTVGAGDVSE